MRWTGGWTPPGTRRGSLAQRKRPSSRALTRGADTSRAPSLWIGFSRARLDLGFVVTGSHVRQLSVDRTHRRAVWFCRGFAPSQSPMPRGETSPRHHVVVDWVLHSSGRTYVSAASPRDDVPTSHGSYIPGVHGGQGRRRPDLHEQPARERARHSRCAPRRNPPSDFALFRPADNSG